MTQSMQQCLTEFDSIKEIRSEVACLKKEIAEVKELLKDNDTQPLMENLKTGKQA